MGKTKRFNGLTEFEIRVLDHLYKQLSRDCSIFTEETGVTTRSVGVLMFGESTKQKFVPYKGGEIDILNPAIRISIPFKALRSKGFISSYSRKHSTYWKFTELGIHVYYESLLDRQDSGIKILPYKQIGKL